MYSTWSCTKPSFELPTKDSPRPPPPGQDAMDDIFPKCINLYQRDGFEQQQKKSELNSWTSLGTFFKFPMITNHKISYGSIPSAAAPSTVRPILFKW
jgi:hypothetical protein